MHCPILLSFLYRTKNQNVLMRLFNGASISKLICIRTKIPDSPVKYRTLGNPRTMPQLAGMEKGTATSGVRLIDLAEDIAGVTSYYLFLPHPVLLIITVEIVLDRAVPIWMALIIDIQYYIYRSSQRCSLQQSFVGSCLFM